MQHERKGSRTHWALVLAIGTLPSVIPFCLLRLLASQILPGSFLVLSHSLKPEEMEVKILVMPDSSSNFDSHDLLHRAGHWVAREDLHR